MDRIIVTDSFLRQILSAIELSGLCAAKLRVEFRVAGALRHGIKTLFLK
jgi:hypothetical protein